MFIGGVPMNCGDEHRRRAGVHLLRRADLLEAAAVHHRDVRAHRHRLDLVVGDVDERRRQPAVQRDELGARLAAQLRVEVADSGSSMQNTAGWRTIARASATR